MYKLSEVEAFRAQVLLEEALRKLDFLTNISSSASMHGDELTQFMGDEISRIIQEQRDLEKKYEELIAQRGQLKGLVNKNKFLETQKEIQDVAHRLKESNKNLCRNLKENPNVQGNLLKMQAERALVQFWFEGTKTELIEMSFANLVNKVEMERREQERLNEVRKKEKEATQTVRQLEAEREREYESHEKDTKQANQDIKDLKEDLQKNRNISEIEYQFEDKKLRAHEQALIRIHNQIEKKLVEELEELQRAHDMEKNVHDSAHVFLEEKVQKLLVQKDQWMKDLERETNDREVELNVLRDRRDQCRQDLNDLEEKRHLESVEQKAKESEMLMAVRVAKQRRKQAQREEEAIIFLQEEGRRYMERLAAKRALMKGKKGKKGKKK